MADGSAAKTKKSFDWQKVVLLGILLCILAFFYILNPRFLSAYNLANMSKHVSFVIISGCAVTILMIAGGLDISMGSVIACSGVFCAYLSQAGLGTPFAFFLTVCFGAFVGLINAVVVVKLKITSFIATLGMLFAARGVAFILCNGIPIRDVADNFGTFGQAEVGPFPMPFIVTVVVVAAFLILEKKHVLGKYSAAIGGNKTAATLSGIRTDSILMLLYVLVGICTAFAGVLLASRLGVGDPKLMDGFEFTVITAVIIGGTSLDGGEGSILGMVIGALIIAALNSGLNILGVLRFWQQIVSGVVLVMAVYMDIKFKARLKRT